ncbi:S9 family peptidase [Sphingobacterium corticis]|uniref:S9 family peptidase n=1 Tax=Sphingobacterium corticis TaxID=1812823 RepID=A0ABW5NMT1_9SPHI
MNFKPLVLLSGLLLSSLTGVAQEQKPAITWKDIPKWEYLRLNVLAISNDSKWYAYAGGPTQGDLKLQLKSAFDTTSYHYNIGGATGPIRFNEGSSHVAFFESPSYKEIKANEKSRKPNSKKLRLVTIKDTSSVLFERATSFEFSNDGGNWLAVRFESAGPAQKGSDAAKGSDLLLYNLNNKQSFNVGNVNEFQFNKSGQYLVYTIDANGKNGNGVFLRNMQTGTTYALDNDKANYSKLNWNKEGTALALLKSKTDKSYKDPVYTLIGVKDIKGDQFDLTSYTGLDEKEITAGFGISENSTPYWSKDLSALFFGIAKLEKTEKAEADTTAKDSTQIADNKPQKTVAKGNKDTEKPDMIIWNWQDKRLQSAQRKQAEGDKNRTVQSAYFIKNKRFVSLADSALKNITLSPKQDMGYAFDYSPYEREANLDGQQFADLYLVDIASGDKRKAIEKLYLNAIRNILFSPDGKQLLYYRDGDYYNLNTQTLNSVNLTKNISTSFVAEKVDNNVTKPATSSFGWTADGKFVLLKDNFDLWKVSADGKSAVSVTKDWKKEQWTPMRLLSNFYKDDDFTDLKKDQYFVVFNDATKQSGIATWKAGSNTVSINIHSDDVYRSVEKPKGSNTIYYTKENNTTAPELYIAEKGDLSAGRKLTENTPTAKDYALSSGSKLIEYVNDFGDTLQATIFLPANYVEGQSYPTITYIYERLTDGTNNYAQPAFPGGGFNRAVYTSNGYAVLMPDIAYKLNDPGMSAVACVVPAVKAAAATGIVDSARVGIHGHSWGGYQTSFLITQTNIFKAAVAGAPLTNMISMYSLIYWNSGSTNQSIFESSQGRLTSGYWDNWDAYTRNSPIYHIKNVETPLVILHNDKDGAVDYTQGIEYFNGLRRLQKPVTMLTYNGENHGLMKEVNQKDYAVRMMEFFDHYLKGSESPDWWAKGIDYLDMEKHLEARSF